MSRKESIRTALSVLNPHSLEIVDISESHMGHAGNTGTHETHFQIRISSSELLNHRRVEQHRIINNLLSKEFSKGLHALSITIVN